MASLIAGTWSWISSSAEVISKARGMTAGIHRLLQPDFVDLSDADRRRLLGLQRRVHAMVQPLNFLLLWSKHRDCRVQQVVLGAQELLFDIYSFIECFASDESPRGSQTGPKRRGSSSSSSLTKSEQLDFFLRELDFTCMSVNMAICMEGATPSTGCLGDVSPLALLRAHRRIKEMQGRSGHLCTLTGCLYQDLDGGLETDRDVACRAEEWRNHWTPALSLATFKVVAKLASERRYHLEVESRLPLSQGDLPFLPPSDEETALAVGLNSFTRMEFPIRTACRATLLTTGHLRLATASPSGPKDTLVDSLALVWDQEGDLGEQRDRSQPKKGRRFAFVFDGRNSGGDREASGIVPELAITPLDAIYLARLCAVDADAEFAALHKPCRERRDEFRGVGSSGSMTATGMDVSAARLILRDAVSPTRGS